MEAEVIKVVGTVTNVLLTDDEIQRLIVCPKRFISKPREPQRINKNMQQKFTVQGADTGTEFDVFITWSQMQPQDFSIGLMLGDYLLLRVNGFHGITRAGFHTAAHHAVPHTHTLTMVDIENGRARKPSKITNASGEFVDLITAQTFFFRTCGIIGFEQYFPTNKQISIDDL